MKTYDRRDEVIDKITKRYGFQREDHESKLEKMLGDLYDEACFDGYIAGMKNGKIQAIGFSNDDKIRYLKHVSYVKGLKGLRDGKKIANKI
jgi:hypothetical protein